MTEPKCCLFSVMSGLKRKQAGRVELRWKLGQTQQLDSNLKSPGAIKGQATSLAGIQAPILLLHHALIDSCPTGYLKVLHRGFLTSANYFLPSSIELCCHKNKRYMN